MPWIAYPGSTIQQNFGETLDKGFLIWNIDDRDKFSVEFEKIDNPNPFITIDWCGSVRETLKIANSNLRSNSRIRIRSQEPIAQSDIRQLYNELNVLCNPIEIVMKLESSLVNAGNIDSETHDKIVNNLRDPAVIVDLMKKFYNNSDISNEDWQKITDCIEKYSRGFNDVDGPIRHNKWSVKRMSFDNTFSFGRGNVIDFESLDGIVGVFAPNARGKSSIVGTLMYALFNATDRGPIKNLHVINTRKGECVANVTVDINGNDYVIERKTVKREPKKGLIHGATSLEFYKVDADGKRIEDATGEARTDTDKEIRRLIGTSEDFLLTSLASQGDINRFIDEGATQRKMILAKLLDLDVMEQMANLVKDDSNNIKVQLKLAPDRDWDTQIERIRHEMNRDETRLVEVSEKLTIDRQVLGEAQINLSKFSDGTVITQFDVDEIWNSIISFNEQIALLKATLINKENDKIEVSRKLDSIKKFKEAVTIDDLRSQKAIYDTMRHSLDIVQRTLIDEKKQLERLERSILKLAEVPCGTSFPSCKFIKDSYDDSQKIDNQRKHITDINTNIIKLKGEIDNFDIAGINEKIKKYDEILKRESELSVQLVRSEAIVLSTQKDIEVYEQRLDIAKNRHAEMSKCVINNETTQDIERLKTQIKTLTSSIISLDGEKTQLTISHTKLETQLSTVLAEREEFTRMKNEWRLYEYMLTALSKRGIPSQIIHGLLPRINAEISKILQGVVDFTVTLEVDVESNSMDIFIDYGDSKRIVELASGMEKMIAALAIRVALINISSLPKTDMLIIDEGFGVLDETNIAACNRLLESLKQWFRIIIVISHVDGIKDAADCTIEIQKNGKDSRVICE